MAIDREKNFNLDSLSSEQQEILEKKLGKKLSTILDKAAQEANKMLNIYGVEVQIAYKIKEK